MLKHFVPLALMMLVAVVGCSSLAKLDRFDKCPLAVAFEDYRNGIFHVGQREQIDGQESPHIRWLGTAFLVDEHCTFATAKHIFQKVDKTQIVIRFQLPRDRSKVGTVSARVLYEDNRTDLAFLRIDNFNNSPSNSKSLHICPLPLGQETGSLVGERVLIIGHPTLAAEANIDTPVVRTGIVSTTEISWNGRPMILLDLSGVPGFSGSPVILQRTGQVIGVIFGPGPTKRTFGFEWATPITEKDYLRAVKASEQAEDTNLTQ